MMNQAIVSSATRAVRELQKPPQEPKSKVQTPKVEDDSEDRDECSSEEREECFVSVFGQGPGVLVNFPRSNYNLMEFHNDLCELFELRAEDYVLMRKKQKVQGMFLVLCPKKFKKEFAENPASEKVERKEGEQQGEPTVSEYSGQEGQLRRTPQSFSLEVQSPDFQRQADCSSPHRVLVGPSPTFSDSSPSYSQHKGKRASFPTSSLYLPRNSSPSSNEAKQSNNPSKSSGFDSPTSVSRLLRQSGSYFEEDSDITAVDLTRVDAELAGNLTNKW
eukprot:CAMPEP_0175154592 /NCGR_PEP_ID=MMETSP0087-20121206/20445_1 /TAXON_ID=136419 /ORGANISM="Unknown Unknown, Strain D1" /LENGTH=274 /DNA_ID=CAMNT_0016441533 /DNA_START=109 /DNA_END=930 /DNA_ORIENTATION=+